MKECLRLRVRSPVARARGFVPNESSSTIVQAAAHGLALYASAYPPCCTRTVYNANSGCADVAVHGGAQTGVTTNAVLQTPGGRVLSYMDARQDQLSKQSKVLARLAASLQLERETLEVSQPDARRPPDTR